VIIPLNAQFLNQSCRLVKEKMVLFAIPQLRFFYPPLAKGSCEEIGLVLFRVIPAKAGIQCFHGVTNTLDPGFHRGDEYGGIFSQLQGDTGGFQNILVKSPPCLRPAGRDFAQAGRPSLPVYDRKRITKEGYKSTFIQLVPITDGLLLFVNLY
jgi:hypothetical protein